MKRFRAAKGPAPWRLTIYETNGAGTPPRQRNSRNRHETARFLPGADRPSREGKFCPSSARKGTNPQKLRDQRPSVNWLFFGLFSSGIGTCGTVHVPGGLKIPQPAQRINSAQTANFAGWHLATNSFHQHMRLILEISLRTFFPKKYFDPMEKYVFQ